MRYERGTAVLGGVAAAVLLVGPEIAAADNWRFPAGWGPSTAESGVNLPAPSAEGCPIETPDGLSLIIASNRRGLSGNDIWAADRPSIDEPFGEPRRIEDPISLDTSAEFCPFPTAGRVLFFVSTRDGGCGRGDIYWTRQSPAGGYSEPVNLGCAPNGPNTGDDEYSPMLIGTWYGTFLYFSTGTPSGDGNIHVSVMGSDGTFGPSRVVSSLSSPSHDFMPNIRARDHGGYEVVFNSTRETWGRNNAPAFGGQDVYTATAWWLPDAWTTPTNVGPNVNTAGNETRATLSGDGERLHFGRDGDIYVSERNH